MQCKCGGATQDASAKCKPFELRFARCEACGRVGREVLRRTDTGQTVATGVSARKQYQEVKEATNG